MLTGITTRTSTPQEDAEPWPGGSARPVLDYLTGTLGMTGAAARELLKAARTAQAGAGPGTLADYPVPGGDAHLLIHYAPGSRAYRFKLTAPGSEASPGTNPEPGKRPGLHGPSRGRETPDGSPAGDAGGTPVRGLPAPPGGAAQPGPTEITVTIWHNVAFDGQGRHTAMLDGYHPGDHVVRVFAYQARPGRPAEEIAEEAFAIFNDHPADAAGAELACAYYGRRLRSLSVGDVVAAGDVLLAVGRPAGWEPVTGPLTEVRTREHGTNPLPDPGWPPGAGTRAGQVPATSPCEEPGT